MCFDQVENFLNTTTTADFVQRRSCSKQLTFYAICKVLLNKCKKKSAQLFFSTLDSSISTCQRKGNKRTRARALTHTYTHTHTHTHTHIHTHARTQARARSAGIQQIQQKLSQRGFFFFLFPFSFFFRQNAFGTKIKVLAKTRKQK